MIETIYILAVILYAVEAYHDAVIEEIQDTKKIELIKKWHKIDGLFHFVLMVLVSYSVFKISWNTLVLFIGLMAIRQLFFATTLNKLRGRKLFYLGTTSWFDRLFKGKEILLFTIALLIIAGSYLVLKLQVL